eukprot:6199865-Pleurochrysis_carterae.AAC.1
MGPCKREQDYFDGRSDRRSAWQRYRARGKAAPRPGAASCVWTCRLRTHCTARPQMFATFTTSRHEERTQAQGGVHLAV